MVAEPVTAGGVPVTAKLRAAGLESAAVGASDLRVRDELEPVCANGCLVNQTLDLASSIVWCCAERSCEEHQPEGQKGTLWLAAKGAPVLNGERLG